MFETQIAPVETHTDPSRTRTYSWSDPRATADQIGKFSGLETLRAIGLGHLPSPPIMHTLGMAGIDVEEGKITFTMRAQEFHYNPLGTVHGGIAATLLDSVMGCCIHTTLKAGIGYTTVEIKVNYVRAMTDKTGPVKADGKVINVGSRIGTSPRSFR